LRAWRGWTRMRRKCAMIFTPDNSAPLVFCSSWMWAISASLDAFSSAEAYASQDLRLWISSEASKGERPYCWVAEDSSLTYSHFLRLPWTESVNFTSKYPTSGRTQMQTPPTL
jgi:hypothetical protein